MTPKKRSKIWKVVTASEINFTFFQKRRTVPEMLFMVENCILARNGKVFWESL
jgi:hypothetical protein